MDTIFGQIYLFVLSILDSIYDILNEMKKQAEKGLKTLANNK